MSLDPLVSVVIIFLDAGRFIEEAIESVFAQTYANWELLLIDDGSKDVSTDVALRRARQYPTRVRYFEHPGHQNHGMSASRNLGIRNAAGSYIALLDADDVWLPGKLEEQVAILETVPDAGMVYGPAHGWRGWTGKTEDMNRDWIQNVGVATNDLVRPQTLVKLFLRNQAAVPYPSCVLLRRAAINGVGGFEEDFKGLYEDQVFFAKLCLRAPVFVADRVWCRYRIHPEMYTAAASRSGQYHAFRRLFLEWLENYLARERQGSFGLRSQLWWELTPYRFPIAHNFFARLAFVKNAYRFARRASRIAERYAARGWGLAIQSGRQRLMRGSRR